VSITLPTYKRREMPLLPRPRRVRAIIATGLRREFRRPAAIVVTGLGTGLITITSIVLVLFARFLLQGQPLDLSFFAIPASSPFIFFFVTLMSAIIGSGLIADDLRSMAFTLYLSRPITHADYLLAKAAILAPLVAMITVLPLVLTPIVAALLGLFSWTIALEAIGLSLLVGGLLTVFYTSVALFLSSLTRQKWIAAAGVFAVNFGLTIPAAILASTLGNSAVLYASPWDNYLAVTRAAFGAPGNPIDWVASIVIVLAATVLAALVTYMRMKAVEVVSG
jgi:ABC-type transport system involved in multi-copper enzyme maturation permease subunit